MPAENFSEPPTENPCPTIPLRFVGERFWLVTVCGSAVALISLCENAFLFSVLASRRHHRNSHSLYLILLAFFDFWMAFAYIPLMSVNVLVDYVNSVVLLRAWFTYMVPMITISHCAMTASSFLIVAASLERYVVTARPRYAKAMHKARPYIAAGTIAIGVFFKFSMAFEFNIGVNEECRGTMSEFTLTMSDLSLNPYYNTYWRVGFRNVFTILLPFILLSMLNVSIVNTIQRSEFNFVTAGKLSEAKRKARIRAATRTLVFVVFTYLLSNVLNVVITVWEYIDFESITSTTFYFFAVDVVSLATIIAGALRPPIYVLCQSQLRKELIQIIKRVFYGSTYRGYTSTTMSNLATGADDTEVPDGEDFDQAPQGNEQARMLLGFGAMFIAKKAAEVAEAEEKKQQEEAPVADNNNIMSLLQVYPEKPPKSVSFVLENDETRLE